MVWAWNELSEPCRKTLVVLFACGEEGGKDTAMSPAFRCKRFRMPLDAQNETVARALNPFDNAIVGNRVDDQSLPEVFYSLMMAGIDLYAAALDDRVETCLRDNVDVVAAVAFFLALFVCQRGG